MKIRSTFLALAGLVTLTVGGCNNSPGQPVVTHKLVATGGQTSIALYPDEQTLIEVSHKAQQGGVTGMVGSVEKNMQAKQIDDQTPVVVLATDDNGTEVQISDGPLKGQSGWVTKQSVN